MEVKQCKQCGEDFEVTDDDLAFLENISPEFGGQKYLIDSPKLCHKCRQIRRLVWRNERSLYKRKSDKGGEEIVSIYSPDKTDYKVYLIDEYQSDDWDALEYGFEFDFNLTFFQQYDKLIHLVPRKTSNSIRNENSEFCNQTWQSKDSYLCFNTGYAEKCMYCTEAFYVKDCVDCFDIRNCEGCFNSFDCEGCNNCQYIDHCKNCSESYFAFDCMGCQNVFMSTGQRNKQYVFENQQLSKEEYESKIAQFDLGNRTAIDDLKNRFKQLKKSAIHKFNHNIQSENCTGDYLNQCHNCHNCYNSFKADSCVRVAGIDDNCKQCRDMNIITEAELCYEGTSVTGHKNLFSIFVVGGSSNMYCNFCENCNDCFGCVGLNKKQYCILNKQYSKEEYESLMIRIIEKMKQDEQWGEFFEPNISPFGYNETLINLYDKKTRDEAIALGAKWQENDFALKFEGNPYEPSENIAQYENEEKQREVLGGVLVCKSSGKAFKILPQELAYYLQRRIPIPRKHSEERFMELFHERNPRVLFHRQCMCEELGHDHDGGRCKNEFETTYAPDRKERVYCEKCYQSSVL